MRAILRHLNVFLIHFESGSEYPHFQGDRTVESSHEVVW